MDRPFHARVAHYLLDNALPNTAMIHYYCLQTVPEFKFNPQHSVLLMMCLFALKLYRDTELHSTLARKVCCCLIIVTCLTLGFFCLPEEVPHALWPHAFNDWVNEVWPFVLVPILIVKYNEEKNYTVFNCYLERAQQRFPNVERGRLLRVAAEAMYIEDPHGYIDNYKFPAVGA